MDRSRDADADAVVEARLRRCLPLLRAAVADRDAVAFVHAGEGAHGRYLAAPAVVVTPGDAVVLREPTAGPPRAVGRDVTVRTVDDPAASVARVVDEVTAETGTVLTPRSVRHDVALFLERAGFDVASSQALETARAGKTSADRDALRRLGAAATAGIDAVRSELAATAVDDDGVLVDEGERAGDSRRLTASRLTDDLRVALAHDGVDAGESRVWSVDGPSLVAGRPVVVACRPVGVGGLRLHAAATVVVDGDGGWERRASLALDHAHRAGRERIEGALDDGTKTETAGGVESEVRAELAAYGFEQPTVTVHGVGCASRERPLGGDELEAGQAVVVGATVERTDDETTTDARRSDVVTRTETLLLGDEVERLVSVPSSLSPDRG